ncbi:MAG: hypothetical protein RLZZ324_552 [Candidatus Parcubacteria bacterium]
MAKSHYPQPMANVIVYSTPTCPYCKLAKEYMTEKGVAFTNVDVSSDPAKAEEMIKKSGQMGVPVIDVDGKIIVGFDKEGLKAALKLA